MDDGTILEQLRVVNFMIDQRRRPHAVTARWVDLRTQRILPFATEAGSGDVGPTFRLGTPGRLPHGRGCGSCDRLFTLGNGFEERAGHGRQRELQRH